MRHGISEQSWLGWLDGTLEAGERSALETHLRQCADCHRWSRELGHWHEQLQAEAERLRAALSPGEVELGQMVDDGLRRIREVVEAGGVRRWTVTEALAILRFLMEPICGPGTVRAVVERAAERSRATGRSLTWGDWGLFVSHLSDTAASVCGSAVGRLVARAGLCLAEVAAG